MAPPRTCPKCQTPHFNFQKCRVRENQKDNVELWKARPNLPEGYRVWNHDYTEEFEQRGTMIVQKSGLKPLAHLGRLIEPKEQHD